MWRDWKLIVGRDWTICRYAELWIELVLAQLTRTQAHTKSALVGASVTVPIKDGKLLTGTWQGIWYLEFRASKHSRKVVATIQGEKM